MFVWREAASDFVAEHAEEHVLADLDAFVEANLEDVLGVLRARGYDVEKGSQREGLSD